VNIETAVGYGEHKKGGIGYEVGNKSRVIVEVFL